MLFGCELRGRVVLDLFCDEDRPRLAAMLSGAVTDRVGCVFGAEARLSRFRSIAIEAMLTPEPREATGPARVSACLIAFGFPYRRRQQILPPLSLTSARFVDLDGFADGASVRWPIRGLRRG